jgi:hypothetical protein
MADGQWPMAHEGPVSRFLPSTISHRPSAIPKVCGALGGTRTPGLKVRNLSLYPLSYKRASDRFAPGIIPRSARLVNAFPGGISSMSKSMRGKGRGEQNTRELRNKRVCSSTCSGRLGDQSRSGRFLDSDGPSQYTRTCNGATKEPLSVRPCGLFSRPIRIHPYHHSGGVAAWQLP